MASKTTTHNGAAAAAAAAGKSATPPNQTLYLSNLPEKLSKPNVRLLLYTLFATYGPVLDVVAMRGPSGGGGGGGMRGQAHVVLRDVQTAGMAMRALQGFEFGGKSMGFLKKVQYAKGKSDVIAKLDGTYKMTMAGGEMGAKGTTDLQKEVFGGVPGSSAVASAPPPALPKAAAAAAKTDGEMEVDKVNERGGGGEEPKGVKRGREDDDDEGSEDEGAPMEQDSDDDAPMEEDSDDE